MAEQQQQAREWHDQRIEQAFEQRDVRRKARRRQVERELREDDRGFVELGAYGRVEEEDRE